MPGHLFGKRHGTRFRRMEIARHRRYVAKTFLSSERYKLEVDHKTYARDLRKDMKRGVAGS